MKKSQFNLSHTHLTSCDMGELVPIGLQEVVQGDVFNMATSALVRLSPLLAPVMHPTHVTIHHWFVPHRLTWVDFEDFITGGRDGTSAPTFPTITLPNSGSGGVVAGSLANYLGVPLGYNADNSGYTVSALPFRAYAAIWNQNYRDEDLQTLVGISKASGDDTTTNTALQFACWEKDYYTSARPSPQKGPAVTLPLGSTAPITRINNAANPVIARQLGSNAAAATAGAGFDVGGQLARSGSYQVNLDPNGTLVADLALASGASISDFRLASAIQRFMEKRSRNGSRFIEYLRSMGIRSSDARLQLPEYLGGGKQTIQISEVLQTAEGANPVGELRGHGISALRSNRFVRFFEEPGYIVSLAYINPKTIYTQSLARHWNRRTKLEFFQPELQFIGQQAIKNKEVYAAHTTPEGTFGYQDRYDELRRSESRVSGEFLTTALNFWHFGRAFSSSPALNGTFVKAVPTDIPFAVPSEDVCYLMVRHQIQAQRLVARDATPRIM